MPLVLAHAWRSWKSARAVFALAVVALAVGLGSTIAIYTVVNAVMLKPLAYEHGERYAQLFSANVGIAGNRGSLGLRDLLVYQQAQSFDLFGWFKPQALNLTSPGAPRHLAASAVTTRLVQNLGVQPLLGQWFQDERGAVISRALWMQLGGDPKLVGTSLVLNGRPFTLTGVMPDRFRLPEVTPSGTSVRTDVWIGLDPDGKGQDPDDGFLFSYVRLKPGVTFAQAEAEVKTIAAEIARKDPARHRAYTAALDPLSELVGKSIRPTLLLLLGAAGVLLLITCANVAALLLARSVARATDTAIRVALGVGRGRLAFQYFVEGLIVSGAGAALGVLASIALVRGVVAVAASYIPRAEQVAIDWRVLAFALAMAIVASALSSLAPLWQALRMQPNAVLTHGVRASAGLRTRRLSRSLVTAEIALAVTLLAASGVLIAHLRSISRISPGFDPTNLLTFQIALPDAVTSSHDRLLLHQKRLIDAVKSVPGVTHVAFANQAPLDGCCLSTSVHPEGNTSELASAARTAIVPATPDFWETMRIPLRRGRLLNATDTREDPMSVVVNEAAVRTFWPDRSAEGAVGHLMATDGPRFQVVGIVGDIHNDGLDKPPVPEVYVLHAITTVNPMQVFVRSTLPEATLVAEIRQAIARVDPAQPIHGIEMFADIVQQSVTVERLASIISGFFAAAALLMAALGIYGVVSYSVRQRTVEIGTRMAIGAQPRDLISLIVGNGLRMAVIGIALGGVGVAAVVWLLQREFDVHQLGVLPFAGAAAIIGGVAGTASFVPAWRATRLSPLVAMRDQAGSVWQAAQAGVRQAIAGVSRALSGAEAVEPRRFDGSVVTGFAEASRRAASNQEALQMALASLRGTLGAEWALLLEPAAGDYRAVAAAAETPSVSRTVPARGFLLSRLRFHRHPLPFTSADLDACGAWAREHDAERVPEIAALVEIGARVAVPLRTKRDVQGILLLGPLAGGAAYGTPEWDALSRSADLFALMLENARLTDRILEEEKLRRDLALAAEVQKRLLPDRPPDALFVTLAAVSVPARSVGGDYYDFLEIGDRRIGLALADVSGKGVAAALIMSVVHASLRIISSEGDVPLPQLAARMNGFLHRCTQANSYATFFYAQLEDDGRRLRYVNAGHNPPYLVRKPTLDDDGDRNAAIQELRAGGTVIGLFPHMQYEEATLDLQAGDVLVMFTDGVPEALNTAGEEFGEARLQALVREVAPLPVQQISVRLVEALRAWTQGAPQHDDLTFVLMKVKEGEPPSSSA